MAIVLNKECNFKCTEFGQILRDKITNSMEVKARKVYTNDTGLNPSNFKLEGLKLLSVVRVMEKILCTFITYLNCTNTT